MIRYILNNLCLRTYPLYMETEKIQYLIDTFLISFNNWPFSPKSSAVEVLSLGTVQRPKTKVLIRLFSWNVENASCRSLQKKLKFTTWIPATLPIRWKGSKHLQGLIFFQGPFKMILKHNQVGWNPSNMNHSGENITDHITSFFGNKKQPPKKNTFLRFWNFHYQNPGETLWVVRWVGGLLWGNFPTPSAPLWPVTFWATNGYEGWQAVTGLIDYHCFHWWTGRVRTDAFKRLNHSSWYSWHGFKIW